MVESIADTGSHVKHPSYIVHTTAGRWSVDSGVCAEILYARDALQGCQTGGFKLRYMQVKFSALMQRIYNILPSTDKANVLLLAYVVRSSSQDCWHMPTARHLESLAFLPSHRYASENEKILDQS